MKQNNKKDIIVILTAAALMAVMLALTVWLVHSVQPVVKPGELPSVPTVSSHGEVKEDVYPEQTDPLLTLVNADHPLSDSWKTDLVEVEYEQRVDRVMVDDLKEMLADAKKEGLDPVICSAYRNEERQGELFDKKVQEFLAQGYADEEARAQAKAWVREPGRSEHAMGLAVDIVSYAYQLLDEGQGDTATQKWLMKNCHKYGFILRYPKNKTAVTGVNYEPWHYRYVGRKNAEKIKKSGLCLEEYLLRKQN